MKAARRLIPLLVLLCAAGCQKTQVGSGGTPAQRELMQAFLAAHDKGDLQAEMALVDWEGVSEGYKNHFTEHELKDGLRHRIFSIDIVALPDVGPGPFQGYNLTPEKFLAVQYGGSRSDKRNLYPIGQKDGRYYLTLQTGI